MARLYRVILQVAGIEKAAQFYSAVLGQPGRRVTPGRHYFDCGDVILACYDPESDGDGFVARPSPDHIYLAVDDVDDCYKRVKAAQPEWMEDSVETRPWGERSFYIRDPFGNPVCFVDQRTVFTGHTE